MRKIRSLYSISLIVLTLVAPICAPVLATAAPRVVVNNESVALRRDNPNNFREDLSYFFSDAHMYVDQAGNRIVIFDHFADFGARSILVRQDENYAVYSRDRFYLDHAIFYSAAGSKNFAQINTRDGGGSYGQDDYTYVYSDLGGDGNWQKIEEAIQGKFNANPTAGLVVTDVFSKKETVYKVVPQAEGQLRESTFSPISIMPFVMFYYQITDSDQRLVVIADQNDRAGYKPESVQFYIQRNNQLTRATVKHWEMFRDGGTTNIDLADGRRLHAPSPSKKNEVATFGGKKLEELDANSFDLRSIPEFRTLPYRILSPKEVNAAFNKTLEIDRRSRETRDPVSNVLAKVRATFSHQTCEDPFRQ